MEVISVAVALPGGEVASDVIASVDNHPLLDLCGVARSVPDLMRLLDRFRPAVLLISHSLLEELDPSSLGPGDALKLSIPISFLLSHPGLSWGEEELSGLLRLPLRYGGLVGREVPGAGDLFREIKRKVDIYSNGERPFSSPLRCNNEQNENTGLFTFLGCKGGVGTTFLTCTLAAAMSSSGRRVLLMEMDSELSQLLYLKPRDEGKVLLDLLPLAEEISWDLIRVSVYRHAAGFHLLPYGRRSHDKPAADTAVPEPLLRNLLFLFDVVIQDFPASSRGDFPPLLHHSPTVLLVSLPDTLAATCARSVAAYLHRTGLDYDRLRLVVNRCGAHHALGPDELARAVGIELLAALPDDARSGLDFAELGELPHVDSPLGKAVAEMAAALGFADIKTGKSPALQRFRRLRSRPGNNP